MAYFCHITYNENIKRVAMYEGIDGGEIMEVVRAAFKLQSPSSSIKLRVSDDIVLTSKDFDLTPRRVADILRKTNVSVDLTDPVSSSSCTLADLNILEAVRAFKAVTKKQGHDRMNRNVFLEFLKHIRVGLDETIVEKVFQVMDRDRDGVIDGKELISGLTVLCGGDRDSKIRAAFVLYDKNDDGFIDRHELTEYLRSVFRVVAENEKGKFKDNVTPDALANATASQCFLDCDTNEDGLLSFEEFKSWYQVSPSSSPPPPTSPSSKEGESISLEELRERTGLDTVSCEEVLSLFDDSKPQSMNREQFNQFVDRIPVKIQNQDARHLMHSLFDIFDQNDDGVCDPRELMAGLTVLLKGTWVNFTPNYHQDWSDFERAID